MERRARAESQNVQQPPVSSAMQTTANVHFSPFQIVSRQMAQQLMEQHARAESQNVLQHRVFTVKAHSASAPQHPLLLAQKQMDLLPTQSLVLVAT